MHCNALQCTAMHCNALHHTARHCNALQCTTPHCTILHHTAPHCKTLQHTAARRTLTSCLSMLQALAPYTAKVMRAYIDKCLRDAVIEVGILQDLFDSKFSGAKSLWVCYQCAMGWLRLVGSLESHVSFAEYRLFDRALLQQRPIIIRSLLIVATPYQKDVLQNFETSFG